MWRLYFFIKSTVRAAFYKYSRDCPVQHYTGNTNLPQRSTHLSEYRSELPVGDDGTIGIAEGKGAGYVFGGIEGFDSNTTGDGRMVLGTIVIAGVVRLVIIIEIVGGELQGIGLDEHNNRLLVSRIAPDDVPTTRVSGTAAGGGKVVGIHLGRHGAKGIAIFLATGKRNDCH
jgi:hypothetical protein